MRFFFLSLLLVACSRGQYNSIQDKPSFSLTIMVDAKHFDYRDGARFLRSFFDTDDATFGHAWVLLQGVKQGRKVVLEGGHSGEIYSRYLDRVIGAALNQEANPIQYLFEPLFDGYYEEGSGGHRPTFSIVLAITEAQFDAMRSLIEESRYPFSRYSIINGQCTAFVVKLASLAGVHLEHEVTMPIPQKIRFDGKLLTLWRDPQYKIITIATPDKLEESMRRAVLEKRARPS